MSHMILIDSLYEDGAKVNEYGKLYMESSLGRLPTQKHIKDSETCK